MGSAKLKIAGLEINIKIDHIKLFKSKDAFVKALKNDLQSFEISDEELESALGDTYDLYVPPKVKKDK